MFEISLGNIIVYEKSPAKQDLTFVVQHFYPEFAATAQLMTELAECLVARGIKIKVITGQPSFIAGKREPRKENYKGIEIRRLSSTQFNKNKFLGRILNWTSFTILSFLHLVFSVNRSKLFIVSQPPFLFGVGWMLNIIRKQNYICLIYDLYPDIAVKLGILKKEGVISKIWEKVNKTFLKKSRYIIVPIEKMKIIIEEKIGKSNKVQVIHNWADGEFIRPIDKEENWFCNKYDIVDKLVVLYSGNIGLFHSFEILVEAADKLRYEKKVKFVFIGEGGKKKELMTMVERKKLNNVIFLPYQEREVLPYSLTCADLSVVSLEKGLGSVAAPCKLYTSLAAGAAILGITDSTSDVAQIIKRYNCGFNVEHNDVIKIVDILKKLMENKDTLESMKKNSRRCFEQSFQKDSIIEKYYKLFSS